MQGLRIHFSVVNLSKAKSMKHNYLFVLLLLTAAIMGNDFHGMAQVMPATNASDTTAREISPVQLSNIGNATELTLSKLRDFRNKVMITPNELALDSLIPTTLTRIEKWQSTLDPDEIQEMRLRQTESIKSDFENFRQLLEGWRKTFTSKSEEIYLLRQELQDLEAQWQLTLDVERQEKLPPDVVAYIKNNLKEIDEVSKLVVARNNQMLTSQTRLTTALIYVDEILGAVSQVERSYKEQIFALDMPSIWQVFSPGEDSVSLKEQVKFSVQKHRDDLKVFQINYRKNIYWHLLFFIVLTIVTLFLRTEVKSLPEEGKNEYVGYSMIIIDRPFSSALLITLLLSGMFYPGVSPDVLNYFYVPLIIPMLRLLPGLIPSIDKKYFFYIALVFFLSQLGGHYSDVIVLERIILLIIDGISLFILVSLLKKQKEIIHKDSSINWKFVFNIMRVAVIVLAVSMLANIIGNTFFSRVISRGTLTMLLGGTILYAGTLVLRGIVSLLIHNTGIARLNIIQNYSSVVQSTINKTLNWLAVIYWLYLTLDSYLIFDPLSDWVKDILTREWDIGSVSLSLGSILAFFITLWITFLFSRLIRFLLQDEILTHFELPRGVPGAISMIVRLVLIFVGFILAFGAANIDMSNIAIVFGALGVGIGFGLQNIFNNLVSGLILAFERPVQVGDVIQISSINILGEVKEIGIRASTIRTFDGAEVIVPNGNLISNEMINWTLSDSRRRQEIIIGVAYGTDTADVLKILKGVVSENINVLKEPEPTILFLGFGESSLDFRVLFWTHFQNGISTKSEVGVGIDNAFKEAGITIPFPQRDLHFISEKGKSNTVETKKPDEKGSVQPET